MMNIPCIKRRITALLIAITVGLCIYCAYLKRISESPASASVCLPQIASLNAETSEEVEALKENGKPMIIAFGADYCPTCINYKPYIDALATEYSESIIIKYVDTEEHEPIRYEYNIELIPSTIFYDSTGNIHTPSDEVQLEKFDDIIEERGYISDKFSVCTGEELSLNNNYEYGVNEEGELAYCKYVGLIDMVQLRQIAEELLAKK